MQTELRALHQSRTHTWRMTILHDAAAAWCKVCDRHSETAHKTLVSTALTDAWTEKIRPVHHAQGSKHSCRRPLETSLKVSQWLQQMFSLCLCILTRPITRCLL